MPWGGISPGEAFEVWVLSIPCFWSLRCFFGWRSNPNQQKNGVLDTLECSSPNRSRRWKWWFYRGCHLYIVVHARGVLKQQHWLRSEWRAFQQQVIYKTLWSLRCWCSFRICVTVSWLPEQSHGVLRCSDPHPEKAIFTSGSSASQGEGCDDFLYLVFQGLSGDGFFPCRWEDEGKGVFGKSPKNLNAWMMRYAWCWGVFFDIYWYLLLSWKIHKECICSRRWTKETSAKMFLMMSSLLHIVYDVSWCVSICYSSFHDFESCLIHLFSQSSRPPMFVHSNQGPSERLSTIGKTGATRALWQTSLRIGALRGVSLPCEVEDVRNKRCQGIFCFNAFWLVFRAFL